MPSSSPNSPARQERERVFDVGRAARIMAQLVLVVIAQPQPLAGQAQVGVPLVAPIAPVLVPVGRRLRMAEELDFHLLELARAEGEVARRDLVAKALADLRDAERNADPRAVDHVLEVDEDALGRLGAQKGGPLFAAQRADMVLNIRLNSRGGVSVPSVLASGPSTWRKIGDRGQRDQRRPATASSSTFFARRLKNFSARCSVSARPSSPPSCAATKMRWPLASTQRPRTWSWR